MAPKKDKMILREAASRYKTEGGVTGDNVRNRNQDLSASGSVHEEDLDNPWIDCIRGFVEHRDIPVAGNATQAIESAHTFCVESPVFPSYSGGSGRLRGFAADS
jgi:hypothetical protein